MTVFDVIRCPIATVNQNLYPKWVIDQYNAWIVENYLVANKDEIDRYIQDILLAYDPAQHSEEISRRPGLWNYEYFTGQKCL